MKRHGTADKVKILLSAFLLAASSSGVVAQESGLSPEVGVAEAIAVRPSAIAPAVLMPNAQVPPAPAPLDAAARAAAAAAAGLSMAAGDEDEETAPEPIRLTAAQPWRESVGFLVITGAETVHPESSIRMPAGAGAQAALRLRVEAGASYLVDFSVVGTGRGVYELGADSERRVVDDAGGALRHVVTAVNAGADGWVTVRLTRRDNGFHLFAAEITRLQ